MRQVPAHSKAQSTGYAEKFLHGVETAGQIYSAASTAYNIARGTMAIGMRIAPIFGVL